MKKRSLLLCLALVLSMTMAIGGTLAYLTDTDTTTNVMTLGNVDIKIEEVFDHLKPLYPAVVTTAENGTVDVTGAIQKEVYVKNESNTSSAYVRTILAFPAVGSRLVTLEENSPIIIEYDDAFKKGNIQVVGAEENAPLTIDGQAYTLFVFTYEEALAPKATTGASLMRFYMNPDVTKEDLVGFDGTYRVDVAAQAMQTENMDGKTAAEALNLGFGEITTQNHPWPAMGDKPALPTLPIERVVVDDADELAAILAEPEANNTIVVLSDDVALTDTLTVAADREFTIDTAGHDFTIGEKEGKYDGLVVDKGATLNIVNSDPDKKTTIKYDGENTSYDAIYVNGGELNIGGNVTVEATPKANSAIHATKGATVNIGAGTNVVVEGTTENQFTAIYVDGGSTVNMTGGTITVDSSLGEYDDWNNDVVGVMLLGSGSEFNMTGGTIVVKGANGSVQAVQIATYNGAGDSKIVIDGGSFNVTGSNETCAFAIYDPSKGTVIVKDATFTGNYTAAVSTYYSGKPNITITGGAFAFDPSNYVAEGYKATKANGTWYVTEEDTVVVTDSSKVEETLTEAEAGDTIKVYAEEPVVLEKNLPAGVSLSGAGVNETTVVVPTNTEGERTTGLVVKEGGTEISNVTLEAKEISSDQYAAVVAVKSGDTTLDNVAINTGSRAAAVTVSSFNEGTVTIANSNIESDFKALHIVDGANGKIVIDNCVLSGVYTFNVNSGTSKNLVLEVKDTKLYGWTSYSAIGSATFTNVTFGKGHGYAYFRPYSHATLTNCAFEAGYEVDSSAAPITLVNCTYDGTLLTAENAGVLFGGTVPANVTIK